MKNLKSFFLVLYLVLACCVAFAEEHKDHESHEEHGNEIEKKPAPFEIATHVQKNFGITFKRVIDLGMQKLPQSAVLTSADKKFLYLVRDDKFQSVPVTIDKVIGKEVMINSKEIRLGDQIALTGIPYIKTIETSLNEEGEQGHGH